MNCPECESNHLKIYDSRHIDNYVIRKRKCEECGDKFFTIESYLTQEQLDEIEILRKGNAYDHREHHVQDSHPVGQ